jgi:diguanylate cyclase
MMRVLRPSGRPSIQSDMLNSAFSVLAVIAAFLVLVMAVSAFLELRGELLRDSSGRVVSLARTVAPALAAGDHTRLERQLAIWLTDSGASAAFILDRDGELSAAVDLGDSPGHSGIASTGFVSGLSEARVVRAVDDGSAHVGDLVVIFGLEAIYRRVLLAAASLLLVTMSALALGRYVLKRLAIRVLKPLADLAAVADAVTHSPDHSQRAIEEGPREVADLARAFNTMLDVLQRKSEALEEEMRQSALTEAELDRMTLVDPMTHLNNRVGFQQELLAATERASREGHNVAVVYLDLDDFKVINDSLGHEVGDRLLQAVADRLNASRRDGDVICRVGGDEFAIILAPIHSLRMAVDAVAALLAALAENHDIDGRKVHIHASAGIALYPAQTDNPVDLVRFADIAMHQAKGSGKNDYCVYTSELMSRTNDRLTMEHELRRALAADEFELYYQPQVDMRSGRIVGLEALLRWRRPDGELVPPGHFIPIAEQSDLIVAIGRRVFAMACRQWQVWRDEGIEPRRLAINVSGRQLAQASFADELLATMTESGYPLPRLELEITESLLLSDLRIAKGTFRRLVAAGIKWSLDDFGTGYSSLTYLTKYPIHKIKIDRSFVTRLPGDESSEAIVRAIVAMARGLGLQVVTEGVETREQIEFLRSVGAVVIQGYYYFHPLPPTAVSDLLRGQAALAAVADV